MAHSPVACASRLQDGKGATILLNLFLPSRAISQVELMGDAGAAGKGEESLDALKLKCKVPERIVLLMCSACRLWLRSAGYGGEQLCGTQGKQSLWGREPVWATCTDRRMPCCWMISVMRLH